MQLIFGLSTFLFSSIYVLLLDHIASSSHSLQKALVVVIVVLLMILYRYTKHTWKELTTWYGKAFLIFWGTVLVELLILSTGGFQSPFLVLIHLLMICISFVFSFSLALLFLFSCLLVMYIDGSLSHNFLMLLSQDPSLIVLQLASLFAIIPVAYIVSRQYHMKDALTSILNAQIKTTAAILENLPEIIIVTNAEFTILSTNDAAVRTLQRSRSELLDKPLFDVLLLRDKQNKLVTAKTFFPDGDSTNPPISLSDEFTLIQSPIVERNVSINIQTTPSATKQLKQISFIISFTHNLEKSSPFLFDKTRAKYEALIENIKQKISLSAMDDTKTDVLFLEKIEDDAYTLQTLKEITTDKNKSRIDIAKLCKQIVLLNQEFSTALRVQTRFDLPHFGEKDIAPLTVKNYPVKPEQLTGPFFTIACNAKQIELIIKKLFDLSIMLASTEHNAEVTLSVERGNNNEMIITSSGNCPIIVESDIQNIFVPYYSAKLSEQTNLHLGSGIEGFLAKTMSEAIGVKKSVAYTSPSRVVFTLIIPDARS